uniref:Uncharacterized protein n=1 Tax=Romanomermis culicivorax TaxID=13658 RepID=A0A915J3P9_ROMCU
MTKSAETHYNNCPLDTFFLVKSLELQGITRQGCYVSMGQRQWENYYTSPQRPWWRLQQSFDVITLNDGQCISDNKTHVSQ